MMMDNNVVDAEPEQQEEVSEVTPTDASINVSDQVSAVVSKNQLKRLRRDEYLREKKKQRKEAEKAAKRAVRSEKAAKEDKISDIIIQSETFLNESTDVAAKDFTRSQKRAAEIAEFLNSCDKTYSIIIDCNWESSHSETDLRSLSQQIMFCYSCNKNSSNPSNIILSGVGPLLKAKLEKMHSNNWVGVTIHSKDVLNSTDNEQIPSDNEPVISLPEKGSIIYLTSDAEETIQSLDPKLSYVIGGIVDRNRLKGATYKKAKELGIRTAKLPIKEHFALSATHVLTLHVLELDLLHMMACTTISILTLNDLYLNFTGHENVVAQVNHVFEILLKREELNSWPAALESVLPKRKAPKALSCPPTIEELPQPPQSQEETKGDAEELINKDS